MDTIVMPKLSDMMESGKILSWSKKEGDTVKRGEPVAEVETEKVNIEIESFFTGTLLKILVPAGESVGIGEPIALVGTPAELDAAQKNSAASSVPVGATAGNGHSAAPAIESTVGYGAIQPEAVTAGVSTANETNGNGRVKISPLARRLAQEHGIDVATLRGTGPEGRIVKEDVELALATRTATPQAVPTATIVATAPQPVAAPAVDETLKMPKVTVPGTITHDDAEIVPLTNMRRTIARRLQESAQTAPHFYVTMAMDATPLSELRQQLNHALESQQQTLKISYNDLIVMAVARVLANHPEINASWDNDRIIRHRAVHVGVAVALETGLIVPVVRDANKRTVSDLAREIRRLADAARQNKLRPDEFQGGTFTISNLGMLDVEDFTAIINPPESAILAVGAINQMPVVVNGQIVIRDQIKMTLSSDHRVIDGAQAAYFMRDLKHLIEAPAALLM